jgi:hypothetical protein
MNQSIKYSPDGYYNVKTGNIRTVGEDTVEIDHVLILGDLPDDVGNPNLITADNIGRLYKLPKSSLPPINPFDQDLNTTDSVEFADITLSNVQIDNLQNKLLVLNSTTDEVEYRDVASLPVENPFDQNLNTTDSVEFQKISLKNVNFDLLSQNKLLVLNSVTDEVEYRDISSLPTGGDVFGPISSTDNAIARFDSTAGKIIQNSSVIVDDIGSITTSGSVNCFTSTALNTDFVIVKQGDDVLKKILRSDLFGQDLLTTSTPEFANLTLNNVQIDNLQNKLLVLNSTTDEVEYRDVSSLPVENPFDQNLNTTDTAEFQKISIKNANFDPSVDTDMCINSTAVASLNLDASGSPYPYFTISDRVVNGAGTSLGFGFYRGPNGVARASDTNFVEIAKAHGGNRLFIAGSTVPQVPGTVLNSVASIATLGVDDIVIGVPLKMNSVVINNTQNKLLVLNSATSIVEYRDVSSLPGGDVDGPILSTDNAIARFDNTTGKIIQNSSVIVDDGGGITTSGIINCFTPTFDIEFDTDFVIVKQGNDILKKVLRADLFGQNLTTAGVVRFNTVTTPTLQTDTIVENTVNGGVKVGAWDLKTQKITSDALVSVTDPLTISLKYFGDANSSLSLYAENHDNNGLLFDMNHVPLGGTNDFLSGSVNGNVFINKNVDALDFLFQNGIAKGSSVNKLAMVKTMSLTKTSIDLNQTVNVGQSLICDNLTTDDNTNIFFLTQKDSTNEVMKRDY